MKRGNCIANARGRKERKKIQIERNRRFKKKKKNKHLLHIYVTFIALKDNGNKITKFLKIN